MKKYLYIFIATSALLYAKVINAQGGILDGLDQTATQAGYDLGGGDPVSSLPEMIGTSIKSLIGLLGVIFMGLIIYAGILWMTAAGNEERVTKAKKMLSNATIGLVIVIISWAITDMIFTILIDTTPVP